MATTARLYTIEDLAHLDGEYELDRGMLVPMSPGGRAHSVLCGRVFRRVSDHTEAHHLGEVTCNDPGFVLERGPDTLRGPDVAFVRAERLPPGPPGSGFTEGPPDLAVEVVGEASSPHRGRQDAGPSREAGGMTRVRSAPPPLSSLPEALRKTAQYLQAGCRMVWLLDVARRRVLVFTEDGTARTLTEDDVLEGGDVLPGFAWPVREIFEPLA